MLEHNSSFVPPAVVAKAAAEGLALRAKFRRGSTAVGITLGQELAKRGRIPPQVIRRMYAYFARHEVDKKGRNFGDLKRPSNGYIAWLLWGGDAGRAWATKIREGLLKPSQKIKKQIKT